MAAKLRLLRKKTTLYASLERPRVGLRSLNHRILYLKEEAPHWQGGSQK